MCISLVSTVIFPKSETAMLSTFRGQRKGIFFIIDPLTLPPVQLPWPARVSKWKDDLPVQERVDFERGLISTTREQEIV